MTKVSAGQHLKELRFRFFIVAVFFILGACLAYYFQSQVLSAVLSPLNGQKLVYLTPGGGFNFIFLVSIYAGLALAIPVLIQQLYAFVRPALPVTAHKKSSTLIISSFLLLTAGILFGYFVAVPSALAFLYSFADQYVVASLTAESYLNFIIAYTIGIGLVFQIPLLLLLINSVKPLTPGGLMKSEKWVLLISFIVAAIITPTPDPVNQLIIAGPVIVVYQIGVVIILMSIHKKYRANKKAMKLTAKRRARIDAIKKPAYAPAPLPTPAPQFVPQPVAKALPVQQKRPMSMDGFVRTARPVVQPIAVPKREAPVTQPVARAVSRPARRNFSMDGMYRPFSPQQSA